MAQVAPEPPPDDDSIPNDERLLRRVSKTIGVYRSEDGAAERVASGAFKARQRGEGLSVYVEGRLLERGLTALDVLGGLEGQFNLVAIRVALVRELGNGIILDPDLADGLRGEAHALITGRLRDKALTTLAANSEHIVWD